jgi:hypothetical protein
MTLKRCGGAIFAAFLVLLPHYPSHAAETGTNVLIFSPWSFDGLRGNLAVSKRVTGACWTNSLKTDRPDAWRCSNSKKELMTIQGRTYQINMIYDPCFSGSPSTNVVACVNGAFSQSVVLMTLESSPGEEANAQPGATAGRSLLRPGAKISTKNPPWALRLANGSKCEFASGATDTIAGMRLNYACKPKGWVVGTPDHSNETWKVYYTSSADDTYLKQVEVDTAIY